MEKDFDAWNEAKKAIQKGNARMFYHEREVWWCSLGINIGDEQDGTGRNFDRPILIIREFNEHIFLGIALIGKKKVGEYYFSLGTVDDREASVVLSQIRLIDTKRLVRKIATLEEGIFEELKSALRRTLFGAP